MKRVIMLAVGSMALYRYRYKIVNVILGQPNLRRMFVRLSMRIPFLKERFMQKAFQ
ncbi:hypothetical protein [Metabacillus malikii]|uniref:Uncharacterized protein n=1 Tax=Metabacillus malikii TaxID=1504265 RepID=A0ABT9ZL89_9BACI|nr:hypothetical protein [Metabacillus malikii]MDQ0231980.1 hypothetical protein [Metabacillus malikii]